MKFLIILAILVGSSQAFIETRVECTDDPDYSIKLVCQASKHNVSGWNWSWRANNEELLPHKLYGYLVTSDYFSEFHVRSDSPATNYTCSASFDNVTLHYVFDHEISSTAEGDAIKVSCAKGIAKMVGRNTRFIVGLIAFLALLFVIFVCARFASRYRCVSKGPGVKDDPIFVVV